MPHRARPPFAQLPFRDVPELPRRPHPFWESERRSVRVETPAWGALDVSVRVYGRGPPLLLVHGLMTTSYSWRYVLPLLGTRFTLYMPDLPGSGRSAKPDVRYHPDDLADTIGATLRALDIAGCPVVGNSMGGYLAMRLAMRDPAAIGRLVNLHSPGLLTPRNVALTAAWSALPRPESVLRALVQLDPERWVHRNVHYWDETLKSREEHREYAAPLRTPEGARAFARNLGDTLAAGAMRDFERRLRALDGRFPVPLMLVYAERDPMVPPSIGRRLHALLPGAEMVWLREASHFAHVDAAERFVAAIDRFL
jgi:pimeloyl-ACP methyl ester carboxylesterase